MKLDVSTHDGYAIATALMGPGLPLDTLKRIVTGRIRHAAGVEWSQCVVRGEPIKQYDCPNAVRELCNLFAEPGPSTSIIANVLYHWAYHASVATHLLGLAHLEPLLIEVAHFAVEMVGQPPPHSEAMLKEIRGALDEIYEFEHEQMAYFSTAISIGTDADGDCFAVDFKIDYQQEGNE